MSGAAPSLRGRALALLDQVRADKLARLEDGVRSNCGLGLPYWALRERLGVRGPLARLRLRSVIVRLEDEGLVRRFSAYDSAASVGRAIERTGVPAPARLRALPRPPGQAGYAPATDASAPACPPPRPPNRPLRSV